MPVLFDDYVWQSIYLTYNITPTKMHTHDFHQQIIAISKARTYLHVFSELYFTFMLIVDTTKQYPMIDFDWLIGNSEASSTK